jgi:hypothetical protein
MKAWFDDERSRRVDKLMNEDMGGSSEISFVNTRMDGRLSLDDHTKFYIRKYPGYLYILFDKKENDWRSYEHVKTMCQDVKDFLDR